MMLVSCVRLGYEPLAELELGGPSSGGSNGGTNGGAGGATGAGTTGAGATSAGGTSAQGGAADGGAAGAGEGAAASTGGAAGDSSGAAGAGGAGSVSGPCAARSITFAWSFDSDVEGWVLTLGGGQSGTLSHDASNGAPAPGALLVDVLSGPPNQSAWPEYMQPVGDLSGKTLTANVYLESGTGIALKLYVKTGAGFAWADGGTVPLTLGEWTCIVLDVDNPSYNDGDYDPSEVVQTGFEVFGSAAFRVLIDEVAY